MGVELAGRHSSALRAFSNLQAGRTCGLVIASFAGRGLDGDWHGGWIGRLVHGQAGCVSGEIGGGWWPDWRWRDGWIAGAAGGLIGGGTGRPGGQRAGCCWGLAAAALLASSGCLARCGVAARQ